MTAILTMLASNPWRAAAIGLALALVTGFGIHKVIVAGWKSDLADARQELSVCTSNMIALNAALEVQNAAVKALRDAAAAKQAEAEKRATEARQRAERSRQREASDDRSGAAFMNTFMALTFGG